MPGLFHNQNLSLKLMASVGIALFASIFIWSYFSNSYQEKALLEQKVGQVDKFCNTVLNFTCFAMLHNPNEDMLEVLESMSGYNEIEHLRIFDAKGQIQFTNNPDDLHQQVPKTDAACATCHQTPTPIMKQQVADRTRVFESEKGDLLLGVINPILNTPSCSNAQCHYHPKDLVKLGTLDVVVSLKNIKQEIAFNKKMSAWTAVYLFIILSFTISLIISRIVTAPIGKLIRETDRIAQGEYTDRDSITHQRDEIGKLSKAILSMGRKIHTKQEELNRQKLIYQNLFNTVPCTITVQDKSFRLIEFNSEFSKRFKPKYGNFCYSAYKNLDKKCDNCPVERTFKDGRSHFSEESGVNKDGTPTHWFVKTAPIKDEHGHIVAAMEMSIDISRRKKLEEIVKDSEKKYQAIFKSIPNPVFILDAADYKIMNCNTSAFSLYEYPKEELLEKPFEILFQDRQGFDAFTDRIESNFHERVVHLTRSKEKRYVNIWVQPAVFSTQKILLVTIVDITLSVETQEQLIQAGKMATLGEMATGVAHELNQPLSVIKTASGFILKKLEHAEDIDRKILEMLSREIEDHVDRAAKITNHMRLFGRKTTFAKERTNINDILKRAFDIFSQQLKLREIEVIWNLKPDLPDVVLDPVRLEQVFINLLINARDAIVARFDEQGSGTGNKKITITSAHEGKKITVTIADTGTGIPDAIVNKIFEPFFTTKKVGEGTGLGLSISYGIIKESGGDIRVENNPGGGTVFILVFTIEDEVSHG
jgi:histidine kinase